MRRSASKIHGTESASFAGKTLGDVINAERQVRADELVKEGEQKRLAAEAKATADARAEELRKAMTFTVFEKGFVPTDAQAGRFEALITFKCAYENTSGKDVRAFRGRIQFTDLFGKDIYAISITISNPIASGAKATWDGMAKYNQFVTQQQNLRNTELKDMKVVDTRLDSLSQTEPRSERPRDDGRPLPVAQVRT